MEIKRRDFLSVGFALSASLALVEKTAAFNQRSPEKETRMNTRDSLARFKKIPRLSLVNLSTPIERCDRLRKALSAAPRLFIKRDDCLGYLVGGNKLRKMEYVMAEALRRKATVVVTSGGIQSNHARVTAMAARRLGLDCHLVLNGEIPREPRANFRIDSLLGVTVHAVATRAERISKMDEVARELEKRGERVYVVPLGASDEIGSFGFVAAFEEMLAQQKRLGVSFDAIVFSTSSGGTQAGLETGKRLFRRSVKIIGVSADDPSESIRGYALKAMRPMLKKLRLPTTLDESELEVDDKHFGEGYRIPTEQSREATELFRQTEGILLDPVYTAKAAAGLIDYCRRKEFRPTDNILFWHTGGLLALFE